MQKYHLFLNEETQLGNIFRQELVSMLPVHLLRLEKGDKVLDMCAVRKNNAINANSQNIGARLQNNSNSGENADVQKRLEGFRGKYEI